MIEKSSYSYQLRRDNWRTEAEKRRDLDNIENFQFDMWKEKLEIYQEKKQEELNEKNEAQHYSCNTNDYTYTQNYFEDNIIELLDCGYSFQEILQEYDEYTLCQRKLKVFKKNRLLESYIF